MVLRPPGSANISLTRVAHSNSDRHPPSRPYTHPTHQTPNARNPQPRLDKRLSISGTRRIGTPAEASGPQLRNAREASARHDACAAPTRRGLPTSAIRWRRASGADAVNRRSDRQRRSARALPSVGGCCTKARKDPCASDGGTTDRDLRSIARSHPNPGPGGRVDLMCYPVAQLMHQKVEWFVRQPRGIAITAAGGRARVLAVETNRPLEAVVAAQLKPDGGRSRLLSRRCRAGTDSAVHRHAVPGTDVTVLGQRLRFASRSGRFAAASSGAAATRPSRH